jgi:hypothetical protein
MPDCLTPVPPINSGNELISRSEATNKTVDGNMICHDNHSNARDSVRFNCEGDSIVFDNMRNMMNKEF